MRLSSTAVFTETDTQNVLSRLDELLVFGLRALREAQDCEAAALRSSSEVQAQMTSSILSAQSVMQNQQYEIQLLKESNKQQHEELEVARHRLQQAAASAESLASTLAAQECEILRLQGASQKLVGKKSDRLNPSRMLRSQKSQTDALHAQVLTIYSLTCKSCSILSLSDQKLYRSYVLDQHQFLHVLLDYHWTKNFLFLCKSNTCKHALSADG